MGKKTPKYIVLNKNVGGRFHKPVSGGDDLELLRTYYNGDAYEIVRRQTKPYKPIDTETLMTSAVENAINWGRSHLGYDAMKLLPAEKIAEQWWESGKVNK